MRCEEEFLEYLEKLVRDLDRRINRGKDRLKRSMEAKQRVCSQRSCLGVVLEVEGVVILWGGQGRGEAIKTRPT